VELNLNCRDEIVPILRALQHVGLVKLMMGSWMLECNELLSRTALDGMAETAHFSVPRAWYTRAYALCAVDPDPGKDPIITARLTRYARSGRAEAISDSTVVLPRDGESVPGVTRVGTVRLERDGKQVETPLFLVEFTGPVFPFCGE